jgi:Flp pilus assembly protein TadG
MIKTIKNNKGSIVVIFALLISSLIMACAVSVEMSYSRTQLSKLQLITDSIAISAYYDTENYCDTSNETCDTNSMLINAKSNLQKNNCKNSDGSLCDVTITYPYNGNTSLIQISVSQTDYTLFLSTLINNLNNSQSAFLKTSVIPIKIPSP